MPISDAEIVERVLRGSPDAFRQLVARFERPVLALVRRLVGDPSAAEDLAQDVFLKAFRKLSTYDPSRKLASWLLKIAHNTALDHLRRRGRSPETVPLQLTGSDGGPGIELGEAPADERPDRRLARAELTSALSKALAGLRPEHRAVLVLRFAEGLPYEEIAEITGQPLGTVKVHLHRARKQLAAELERRGLAAPERFRETRRQGPA